MKKEMYVTSAQYIERLEEFKRYMYSFKKSNEKLYKAGEPTEDRALSAYVGYATMSTMPTTGRKIDGLDSYILSRLAIRISRKNGSLSIYHMLGEHDAMPLRDYIKEFKDTIDDPNDPIKCIARTDLPTATAIIESMGIQPMDGVYRNYYSKVLFTPDQWAPNTQFNNSGIERFPDNRFTKEGIAPFVDIVHNIQERFKSSPQIEPATIG